MPYGNRTKYLRACPICHKVYQLAFWELETNRTCSFLCSKEYKKTIIVSDTTKEKLSIALKGKYLKEKTSQWKGENASYTSKHEWIRKNFKVPDRCQNCGKIGKVDAANISGQHKRDISDYEWLCRRCHLKKDGILNKNHLRNLQKLSVKARTNENISGK